MRIMINNNKNSLFMSIIEISFLFIILVIPQDKGELLNCACFCSIYNIVLPS